MQRNVAVGFAKQGAWLHHLDVVTLGLAADDKFELISVGKGVAKVRAQHGAVSYMLDLAQPARLGRTGWPGVFLSLTLTSLTSAAAFVHDCLPSVDRLALVRDRPPR